jgi:hypothetical protein
MSHVTAILGDKAKAKALVRALALHQITSEQLRHCGKREFISSTWLLRKFPPIRWIKTLVLVEAISFLAFSLKF